MKNSLFIGNGLNRSIDSNIKWDDLLKSIAGGYNVTHCPDIALPIEFESIANQILKKATSPSPEIYEELKKKIIAQIENVKLSANAPHYAFAQLPVDNIFTTNYDYLMENSIDSEFDYTKYSDSAGTSNNKYSLRINRKIVDKTIYHVHGELKYPKTICLGYEHYAGALQHMRLKLNKESKEKGLLIKAALLDENNSTNTWAEKFFTDNIHIIGFGLADCEIDIWWLLTYRASLFYSNREGMRDLINNTIIFHDIKTAPDKKMEHTLKNAHVEYQFHKIKDSKDANFYEEYMKIAEELKDYI